MITELKDTGSVKQIAELLTQLRAKDVDIDDISQDLELLIKSDLRTVLIAMSDDEIIGMVVVNIVIKLGKKEARVDEVVVHESARGEGLGSELMQAAIDWAWAKDCNAIELTSRESREAANKLYQKFGFKLRETNVYQLKRK